MQDSAVKCTSTEACVFTGESLTTTCGTGYTGFSCSKCVSSYHSKNGNCEPCPSQWTKALTIVGLVSVISIVGYRLSRTRASLPIDARILIQTIQFTAVYPNVVSKWPSILMSFFSFVSLSVSSTMCAHLTLFLLSRISTLMSFLQNALFKLPFGER
jgi:hypothetical protein